MRVLELLDELVEEVEESRRSVFGNKKVIDVDFVLEILYEIRAVFPDELVYAQQLLEREQEIISSAQVRAKNILDGVEGRLTEMVDHHKVTQLAYEKANRMIDTAEIRAAEIKNGANDYAVNVLDDLHSYLKEYMDIVKQNQSNFVNKKNMNQAEFEF